MSRWSKLRIKGGLSRSQMANELHIPYNKYVEIERGEVKMPTNLIDKFNEIVNRGKHINNLNKLEKDSDVNKWYEYVTTKNENGDFNLKKHMDEYNIQNYKELANLMGISPSLLSRLLHRSSVIDVDNLKCRLYDFFHNELNIQSIKKNHELNLTSWWNDFDLNLWMENNNVRNRDISRATGISNDVICKIRKGVLKLPRKSNLEKIKTFVDNYDKNDIEKLKEQMPKLPTETKVIKTPKVPVTKPVTIIKDTHKPGKQLEKDDNAIGVIKTKLDTYLNNLETLEYEIVKLNEEIDLRKKEMESLIVKKDVLIDILNDLGRGE